MSWADFHIRYRYILNGQRLLTLNAKAERLLKQIPETDSPYVFRNPKTGAEYKLHEFYYLHKKILKRARLPWVAFRICSASAWRWQYDASGYIIFWQETYDKHQSRPTTYAAHSYIFKNHILPDLGRSSSLN